MTCCFCGDEILASEALAVRIRLTNILAEREDAPAQILAAHDFCLRRVLDPAVPFDAEALLVE